MARIRTIKPTFWSHPITGKLSDAAKCMAIALLNLADDEGYFYADPATVRSFCRPFDDDSTITRGCLAELSRVGYIRTSEHPERGPVGHIINFLDHQRIDRANKSEIKAYFIDEGSTRNRRLFDAGREGKGKEEGKDVTPQIVLEIAKAHPKLSHLKDESEIPYAVVGEILDAIKIDGALTVLEGTRGWAAQLDNPKFAQKPYDFFNEHQYRPEAWQRGERQTAIGRLLETVSETSDEPFGIDGTARTGESQERRVPPSIR